MDKEETPGIDLKTESIEVKGKIVYVPWVIVNRPYMYINDCKVWVQSKRKIFLYYMWCITGIKWFVKKYNQI